MDRLSGGILLVSAAGGRYGIPVRDVIEVLDGVGITPVPGVARSVRGVVRYKRGVVAVVPLSCIVSSQDRVDAGRAMVVVIRSSGAPVAIAVDDTFEVLDIRDARPEQECDRRWLLGTVVDGGNAVPIVDTRWVTAELDDSEAVGG